MTNETLDQKIARLERTIGRCIYQMNDTRNTDEIIQTFTRAKAEAERQLKAAREEKAAVSSNTPKPAQNSATDRNTAANTKRGGRLTVQKDDNLQTHVLTSAPRQTLVVKIEWMDSERPPVVLGQGEVLNRFTRTLRDCAESQSAQTENWDKLQMSKQFDTLCLYFRAYALFPRPSQQTLPTQEDMGAQYFVGNNRKKIWELIIETINQDNNE